MRVAIRTDASREIGAGHLMRCLALAVVLRETGAEVALICRDGEPDLLARVEKLEVRLLHLSARGKVGSADWMEHDAEDTMAVLAGAGTLDWLVVDHYVLGRAWETRMRGAARRIMVIEDLMERDHDCDVLLVQNLCDDMEALYLSRVPPHCHLLLGPRYALLAPEFLEARRRGPQRREEVHRILIGFGGGDPTGQSLKALEGIRRLGHRQVAVDVVIGPLSPWRSEVEELSRGLPEVSVHVHVTNMAEMMMHADLAVGGAGVTAWERCCLRLPAIVVTVAENQVPIAEALHRLGAALYLGPSSEVTVDAIARALRDLLESPRILASMSEVAASLVDGLGAYRVAETLRAS